MLIKILKSQELTPFHIAGLAIVLALINLSIHWPGQLTPDSRAQLLQAITGTYSDWHPPIMSVIWRQLLFADYLLQPMLILQISLHWLGIGLFSYSLNRSKYQKAALLMLASGLTPIAFKYTGIIQKDSLLASALIAAFGIASLGNLKLTWCGILIGHFSEIDVFSKSYIILCIYCSNNDSSQSVNK